MKMFVYRPSGYGEDTYMVMAENEELARQYVVQYISKSIDWEAQVENTPEYIEIFEDVWRAIEVYDVGQVAENGNQ